MKMKHNLIDNICFGYVLSIPIFNSFLLYVSQNNKLFKKKTIYKKQTNGSLLNLIKNGLTQYCRR